MPMCVQWPCSVALPTPPVRPQVVKVGRSIATIDVRLLEEGSGVLVAQVN